MSVVHTSHFLKSHHPLSHFCVVLSGSFKITPKTPLRINSWAIFVKQLNKNSFFSLYNEKRLTRSVHFNTCK